MRFCQHSKLRRSYPGLPKHSLRPHIRGSPLVQQRDVREIDETPVVNTIDTECPSGRHQLAWLETDRRVEGRRREWFPIPLSPGKNRADPS